MTSFLIRRQAIPNFALSMLVSLFLSTRGRRATSQGSSSSSSSQALCKGAEMVSVDMLVALLVNCGSDGLIQCKNSFCTNPASWTSKKVRHDGHRQQVRHCDGCKFLAGNRICSSLAALTPCFHDLHMSPGSRESFLRFN